MSSKTIVTCDRCSKEFTNRTEIRVVSAYIGQYSGFESAFKSFQQDWCFNCLNEFGLPADYKEKPKTPVPEPSLEDMIRAIVQQELPTS